MSDFSKQIETLVDKASKTDKSDDALKFSQAAANAANAMCALKNCQREIGGVAPVLVPEDFGKAPLTVYLRAVAEQVDEAGYFNWMIVRDALLAAAEALEKKTAVDYEARWR